MIAPHPVEPAVRVPAGSFVLRRAEGGIMAAVAVVNIAQIAHVRVSKGANDTVRWQCPSSGFVVMAITPDNPFVKSLPFLSTSSGGVHVIDSGALKPNAWEGTYKATIHIGADIYDPHIDVGP